ncbi:unnamed protein product [Ectocarpus sp. 8 AP-2014]
MHAFCGRGIGDEGYGQQRMCTDCQKRTDEGGIGTSSSPMEVDSGDDSENSSSHPAGRKKPETGGKGKGLQRTAGTDGGGAAGAGGEGARREALVPPPRKPGCASPDQTLGRTNSQRRSGCSLSTRSDVALKERWLLRSSTSAHHT